MNVILQILEACPDQHIKIENRGYMALVIERIGTGPQGLPAISVAHYGEQNGDLMRDPEMCFELVQQGERKHLAPYYWRNDYAGIEQESRFTEDGKILVRPRLLNEHIGFARMWNRNLEEQGFLVAWDAKRSNGGQS